MIEFKKDMTIGQIVDALADDYFSQGADALTSYLLALRTVESAFANFASDVVEIFSSFLRGSGSEVSE